MDTPSNWDPPFLNQFLLFIEQGPMRTYSLDPVSEQRDEVSITRKETSYLRPWSVNGQKHLF